MPCLTSLFISARRLPTPAPAQTQDEERQRQAFQRWLTPPPQQDHSATEVDTPSERTQLVLALELLPYQTTLEQLGQFNQSRLTLRLTNGPLAGLEICATAQGSLLHLQARTPDPMRFEQMIGVRSALENELAERFNRPVTLEIIDATAKTE
ncbi:hypothetical protein [Pseudomonas zeae]|uniref:hypothetical protein n=1 Tax=Pseudomonas zeae TaxID=2745510 RepID=UPI0039E1224B